MSAKQSRGGEHLRQVAVAIAGEDHAVAEPQLGHQLLEPIAPLALAHQQQPRLGHALQQPAEARQQQLVARGWRPAATPTRPPAAPPSLNSSRIDSAVVATAEARQVGRAGDPHHALGGQPDLAAARLDLSRHREDDGRAPMQRGGRHRRASPSGRCGRSAPAARACRRRRGAGPAATASGRASDGRGRCRCAPARTSARSRATSRISGDGRGPHAQRQAVHQRQPGLARLGLEAVAGRHAEEHVVAAPPQPADELDDRIGAARPPAVGGQVQHAQRWRRHVARDRRSSAGPERRRGRATRDDLRVHALGRDAVAGRDARSDRCGRSTARTAPDASRRRSRPRGALSRGSVGPKSVTTRTPERGGQVGDAGVAADDDVELAQQRRQERGAIAADQTRHRRAAPRSSPATSASLGAPSRIGVCPRSTSRAAEARPPAPPARAWPGRTRRPGGCRRAGRGDDRRADLVQQARAPRRARRPPRPAASASARASSTSTPAALDEHAGTRPPDGAARRRARPRR